MLHNEAPIEEAVQAMSWVVCATAVWLGAWPLHVRREDCELAHPLGRAGLLQLHSPTG